jgi:hypothetical protein
MNLQCVHRAFVLFLGFPFINVHDFSPSQALIDVKWWGILLLIFFGLCQADWHSLRAALLGSLTLLRRAPHVGAVVGEDAREVARLALENLHVQALAQHDRMLCLEFFQCLLSRHGAAIAPLVCLVCLSLSMSLSLSLCDNVLLGFCSGLGMCRLCCTLFT